MPTLLGETRKRGGALRKTSNGVVIELEYEYRVLADTIDQLRWDILTTAGLPKVALTTKGPTVCTNKEAECDPINPLYWLVTATFSSEVTEDSSGAQSSGGDTSLGDPAAFVPIAQLNFETFTEIGLVDADGDAVVNSAAQPFETGFALTRTLVRYDFEQFEPATTTIDTISDRNETVNDAEYKDKAAKTLKLTVRSATLGFFYGYRVWRVAYSMVYKKDDWRVKRLDIGNCYKSGSDLLAYLDTDGNRIVGNLNGSGGKAAVGTAPSILYFDAYPTSTFSSFLRV